MIVAIAVLSTIAAILGISLYFSVKKNIELIEKIEEAVLQVEESLDILDHFYKRIDKKSKIEVLTDEPVARELVDDMKKSKDAILLIANKLSNFMQIEKEEA